MPKKTKRISNKSKFPFAHPTRHGKMHFKKLLMIVLLGSFALVVIAAITAQVLYNRFVYDNLEQNSNLRIALLIDKALEGLDNIKEKPEKGPGGKQLIPEVKLILPEENQNVKDLIYYYEPSDSGQQDDGYSWNYPENIQITTSQISQLSRNRLIAQTNMEDLLKLVPEAQACNRGFRLQFVEDGDMGLSFSGKKKLSDGRVLYVYREPNCVLIDEVVDNLESYLLSADSY